MLREDIEGPELYNIMEASGRENFKVGIGIWQF